MVVTISEGGLASRDACFRIRQAGQRPALVDVEIMLKDNDPEMRRFAAAFEKSGEGMMIDYRRESKVIVYRAIGNIASLAKLNLNANYSKKLNAYGEDFVTHSVGWATHYGTYSMQPDQGVLIKYEIPANLLEPDRSTRKQEPYYVISAEKLKAAGVTNVAKYVVGLARIRSNHEDNRRNRIWEEDDARLEWISESELRKIVSRSS